MYLGKSIKNAKSHTHGQVKHNNVFIVFICTLEINLLECQSENKTLHIICSYLQYIEHQNRSTVLLRASLCKPAAQVLGQVLAMWRPSLHAQALIERVLFEEVKFMEMRET